MTIQSTNWLRKLMEFSTLLPTIINFHKLPLPSLKLTPAQYFTLRLCRSTEIDGKHRTGYLSATMAVETAKSSGDK